MGRQRRTTPVNLQLLWLTCPAFSSHKQFPPQQNLPGKTCNLYQSFGVGGGRGRNAEWQKKEKKKKTPANHYRFPLTILSKTSPTLTFTSLLYLYTHTQTAQSLLLANPDFHKTPGKIPTTNSKRQTEYPLDAQQWVEETAAGRSGGIEMKGPR